MSDEEVKPMVWTWEDAMNCLPDYADRMNYKIKSIKGKPTKQQVDDIKADFDNVALWLDLLLEEYEA